MKNKAAVTRALERWADWLVSEPQYYPASIAGRMEGGSRGTAQRGSMPKLSNVDNQSDLIHRAVHSLAKFDQDAAQVLVLHFTQRGTIQSKCNKLGVGGDKYRRLLGHGVYFVGGRV